MRGGDQVKCNPHEHQPRCCEDGIYRCMFGGCREPFYMASQIEHAPEQRDVEPVKEVETRPRGKNGSSA